MYVQASNLDQNFQYNDAPSAYVWQTTTASCRPPELSLRRPRGPTTRRTWGGNVVSTKYGWSNNSALQLNYQRPFNKGMASRSSMSIREHSASAAIPSATTSSIRPRPLPPASFPPHRPGTLLKPSREFNRYQNYQDRHRHSQHRVNFNGIVDLPVRQGQAFLGNANRLVDALVGGFQFAFVGNVGFPSLPANATNWGPTMNSSLQEQGADQRLPQRRLPDCLCGSTAMSLRP